MAAQASDVEGELDGQGPVRLLGNEAGAGGDCVALGVLDRLAGGGVHEGSLQGVLGTRGQALVGHLVADHGLGSADHLVPVGLVGSRGVDAHDLDALVHVVDVRMCAHLDALVGDFLERHQGLAGQEAGVELEGDVHGAVGTLALELGHGRDGVAVGVKERLAGLLDHEGARDGIGLADLKVLVVHGVGQCDAVISLDNVVAVGRVDRLGVAAGSLLVGEAHPDGLRCGGVALHPEGLVDELVSLVGLAAKLRQAILAVGQRCQAVVHLRHGPVLAQAEPDARAGVHVVGGDCAAEIDQFVVGVGVVAMRVPIAGRGEVAVAVGADDVALAGGHVGDQERHLQARVGGALRLLGDAEVLADHLVAEGQVVAVGLGLDDYALLAHLECLGLAVGEQVGVVGLGLLDGVGAVGQRVLGRLGRVGLLGVVPSGRDGHDRLAGIVALAVDDDAVGALVHDGELDAVEVGAHGGAVVGASDGL